MLKCKLVPFSETTDFEADDVVSICPAQSEGYFYVWLRSKSKESPADSSASPVQQLKAKIADCANEAEAYLHAGRPDLYSLNSQTTAL